MLEGLSSLAYYRYFSTAMLIPYLGGGGVEGIGRYCEQGPITCSFGLRREISPLFALGLTACT